MKNLNTYFKLASLSISGHRNLSIGILSFIFMLLFSSKAIAAAATITITPTTVSSIAYGSSTVLTFTANSANTIGAYSYSCSSSSIVISTGGGARNTICSLTIIKNSTSANVGNYTINVTQAAGGIYSASTGIKTFTLSVTPISPTITDFYDINKKYGDAAFYVTQATSNSSGTWSYISSDQSVATINATTGLITILKVGSTTITAYQAAAGNYSTSNTTAQLQVAQIKPTISALSDITLNYGDPAYTIPKPTSNSLGAFTYGSSDSNIATIINGNQINIVGAGNCSITAYQASDGNNYSTNSVTASLTINGIDPLLGTLPDLLKNHGDADFDITNPSTNSPGAITYSSADPTIVSISGNTFSLVGDGVVEIICTQAAANNYSAASTNFYITVTDDQVWTGTISTDWYEPGNWSNNAVPLNNTGNANIPSVPTNQPVLSNDVFLNNIILDGNLSINGFNFGFGNLITGTGYLKGSATSSLSITSPYENTVKFGTGATDSLLNNLTLYLGQVTLANSLGITGVLGVYGAILNTGNHLTLISNAAGTASVDDLTGGGNFTGSVINGDVTVQRYHANKRAWLLISAPLTTAGSTVKGDIKSNWQQQTYITAPPAYKQYGMDSGALNNYGMLRWLGSAWGRVTNTINDSSLFGKAGGTTADSKAFFLYVRGDRSIPSILGGTSSSTVTLCAKGALQTGVKNFNISNSTTYALIANPYSAPISLDAFLADNPGLKTDGTAYFYYWDPNNSSSGGYTTAIYNNGEWSYSGKNANNT
ncbi:MAG: hypothetical protein WCP65_06440, partial [Bacteroidota bacterium]